MITVISREVVSRHIHGVIHDPMYVFRSSRQESSINAQNTSSLKY